MKYIQNIYIKYLQKQRKKICDKFRIYWNKFAWAIALTCLTDATVAVAVAVEVTFFYFSFCACCMCISNSHSSRSPTPITHTVMDDA